MSAWTPVWTVLSIVGFIGALLKWQNWHDRRESQSKERAYFRRIAEEREK